MSNDADSHELFAIVPAVHHERVGETLDDGAVGLPEALDGIAACGVRDVDRRADLDVIAVGDDLVSQNPCQSDAQSHSGKTRAFKPTSSALLRVLVSFRRQVGYTHVNEMSRTSTSSYDHLLKSLMEPISSVTSLGNTMYPLGFSTSTSAVSDILGNSC